MSFHQVDTNNSCISYTKHCAKSRTDYRCIFCDVDTGNFTKDMWNISCEVAVQENIKLSHNYQIAHIQGMAVRDHDYAQVIFYRCTNCGDTYVERDDQR